MANEGWSKRFDEPIVLDDGTKLTTLREAIEYLAKTVPTAEHNHSSVLTASDHLTRSAEQNYPMFFARMAWEPAPRNHDACRTTLHAYIMALLGFGSGSSVLSQFFDGATEAPGLAVLRVVHGYGIFELQPLKLLVDTQVSLHVAVAAVFQVLVVRPGAGDAGRRPGRDRAGRINMVSLLKELITL